MSLFVQSRTNKKTLQNQQNDSNLHLYTGKGHEYISSYSTGWLHQMLGNHLRIRNLWKDKTSPKLFVRKCHKW